MITRLIVTESAREKLFTARCLEFAHAHVMLAPKRCVLTVCGKGWFKLPILDKGLIDGLCLLVKPLCAQESLGLAQLFLISEVWAGINGSNLSLSLLQDALLGVCFVLTASRLYTSTAVMGILTTPL